jgi:hypothetical protein
LLRPAKSLGLVLYGGTGIALRLGHRQSVDFDFFTERPLDRAAMRSAFPFLVDAVILQDQPDALTVLVSSEESEKDEYVKLSFFGSISIGRVGVPGTTEDKILQVASLDDLMATKIKVILQRIESKDYQDIAALIRAGISLAGGIASACALYGRDFQPSEALKALVYFEGGDLHELSSSDQETLIKAVSSIRELPVATIASHTLGLAV